MEKLLISTFLLIFGSLSFINAAAPALPKAPILEEDSRIKIAVIDTGVDATERLKPTLCKAGHISLVDDYPLVDSSNMKHGTNVAGLIAENLRADKECILVIKFYSDGTYGDFFKKVRIAIQLAILRKVKFINMSLGGDGASDLEKLAISEAIEKGIRIAVAAGNGLLKPIKDKDGLFIRKDSLQRDKIDEQGVLYVAANVGQDLDKRCFYYPACYKFSREYFRVVGSNTGYINDFEGETHYSNFGKQVTHWENGTDVGTPPLRGTSQATAINTGKWVREIYK